MLVFCLDIGGTGTRGALFGPDGAMLARAEGIGGALSLGAAQAEAAIRDVWEKICASTGEGIVPDPQKTRLFAGIAGRGLQGGAEDLGARLSDFAETHFTGDGYGALLAATSGKPGALISVGTGATALRLNASGDTLALSGWGFPAGDHGSGAWLGLKLTGMLTQHLDGIAFDPPFPASLLTEVMAIAGQTTSAIMGWHTKAKPREYGTLAPLIVAHAAQGDAFSRQLLTEAATEIVTLAKALYAPNAKGDVFLAGGLGAVLLPYCQDMAPSFNWQTSSADAVTGMYLIATGRAPDEKLIMRPGFTPPPTGNVR